jgi:hypothetical protein
VPEMLAEIYLYAWLGFRPTSWCGYVLLLLPLPSMRWLPDVSLDFARAATKSAEKARRYLVFVHVCCRRHAIFSLKIFQNPDLAILQLLDLTCKYFLSQTRVVSEVLIPRKCFLDFLTHVPAQSA